MRLLLAGFPDEVSILPLLPHQHGLSVLDVLQLGLFFDAFHRAGTCLGRLGVHLGQALVLIGLLGLLLLYEMDDVRWGLSHHTFFSSSTMVLSLGMLMQFGSSESVGLVDAFLKNLFDLSVLLPA